MPFPLLESLAREHPAFVHIPLGLVFTLPLAMGASFHPDRARFWRATAVVMASLALAASAVTLFSGLYWARSLALIPADGFLPPAAGPVLQQTLRRHELAALAGVALGVLCLALLLRSLRASDRKGVGLAALVAGLLWACAWGLTGKVGGVMVFGNEELNRAAAQAEQARKGDAEKDLPIRALDYAGLEPVSRAPFRSPAHGRRWARVWVTASGLDAYRKSAPLPAGAYAVLSTVDDAGGRPGQDPGPLYMREVRADGTSAFVLYWARVPEAEQKAFGGEDFVYRRSPHPDLEACAACHAARAAGTPAP
jgi:uncharacterized membrane protein